MKDSATSNRELADDLQQRDGAQPVSPADRRAAAAGVFLRWKDTWRQIEGIDRAGPRAGLEAGLRITAARLYDQMERDNER
jgi:hypothetical protein